MNKPIKAVYKEPYKDAVVIEIKNELKEWQNLVKGSVECIFSPFDESIHILCNDEAKIFKMDGNFMMPELYDCLCGPAVFVCFDEDGDLQTLNDIQINKIFKYIKHYELHNGEDLYRDYQTLCAKALKTQEKLKNEME